MLDLRFEAGRARTAPKLEVDSGYVARCAKLLAVVSLLPVVNGEQTETYHEGSPVIACVITLSCLLLGLPWPVCARWTAELNTYENATLKDYISPTCLENGELLWP